MSDNTLAAVHQAQVRFDAQYHSVLFAEMRNGTTINEEAGGLLFLGGALRWQLPTGLFFHLRSHTATGSLTYHGVSQLGRTVDSTTEYHIVDSAFALGRDWGYGSVYLGLGHQFRERNILGTEQIAGLYEEFQWTYGLLGFDRRFRSQKPLRIRAHVWAWADIDSQLEVQFSGVYDTARATPGKKVAVYTGLEFNYVYASGIQLSLTPAYEYSYMAKSAEFRLYQNGAATNATFYHPRSAQEAFTLTASLIYAF